MTSFADVKYKIADVVKSSNGLKTTEVIDLLPKEMHIFDIPSIIEEMLLANKLAAMSVSTDSKHRILLSPDWSKSSHVEQP